MEKGWRSSRWAAAHPSSLGYWKKKKGEEKYTSAKPLTRRLTRTGWSSLRSLQPYPPLSAHTSLRATRYARWARSPRGGKGVFWQKKEKLQALYIIYDIIHVFLTLESRKKPSTLQNFGAKNLSFSTQNLLPAYMSAQSKNYSITT
jgi:hypothetical protein|nr:MAG TPA: hypothetical protein [Caudoviricetes sp.]